MVLPLLYLAYAWPALPAHCDAAGTTNGYTSRDNLWLLTFGLPVGVEALLSVLPQLGPKRRFDNSTVNFQKLRLALAGLFFAFLGNYLTTVQPNYFVGIRTPWMLRTPHSVGSDAPGGRPRFRRSGLAAGRAGGGGTTGMHENCNAGAPHRNNCCLLWLLLLGLPAPSEAAESGIMEAWLCSLVRSPQQPNPSPNSTNCAAKRPRPAMVRAFSHCTQLLYKSLMLSPSRRSIIML